MYSGACNSNIKITKHEDKCENYSNCKFDFIPPRHLSPLFNLCILTKSYMARTNGQKRAESSSDYPFASVLPASIVKGKDLTPFPCCLLQFGCGDRLRLVTAGQHKSQNKNGRDLNASFHHYLKHNRVLYGPHKRVENGRT